MFMVSLCCEALNKVEVEVGMKRNDVLRSWSGTVVPCVVLSPHSTWVRSAPLPSVRWTGPELSAALSEKCKCSSGGLWRSTSLQKWVTVGLEGYPEINVNPVFTPETTCAYAAGCLMCSNTVAQKCWTECFSQHTSTTATQRKCTQQSPGCRYVLPRSRTNRMKNSLQCDMPFLTVWICVCVWSGVAPRGS